MDHPFLERLSRGVVLADGAMGTYLYERGIPFDRSFDEVNVSQPALVTAIHRDYLAAGAELIETNTFGANRYRLAHHGATESARVVNRAGAQLARNAREEVGEAVFVAGAMGPLGKPVAPLGTIAREEAYDAYREQVEGLVEGGVDLLIIETQSDLAEAAIAIQAARNVTDHHPLILQMTFTEDGRTLYGAYPEDVARAVDGTMVDVLGANCSVGPQILLDMIERLKRRTQLPLSVMPNAGLPRFVNGRFVYLSSPEYLAEYATRFAAAGARLVGGCCGTTPVHTRKMRDALRAAEKGGAAAAPAEVSASPTVAISTYEEPAPAGDPANRTRLSRMLADKTFVVSVEVDPPRGARPKKMIEGAQFLKNAGVDVINVADSPMARVRMSSIALSSMITSHVGIETILHFTCRDRNLMGIQSDLMGAHALGIRNILALTGDPPSVGDFPGATAVYDVDSIGLIGVLRRLNAGTDLAGNSIGEPTRFVIGCAVNPMAEDRTAELDRFRRKIDAGAEFAMTQPLYEQAPLLEFLERLGNPHVPILLGLLPLQSHRHAEFLHNEVPGIVIPDWARKAMREAGDRGVEIGIEMCRSLLLEARDRVAGAYLMPSFGRYEVVARVAEAIRPARPPEGAPGTGQIA